MTLSLKVLARTIAKARHGTDAMWANYIGAAEAVAEWAASVADNHDDGDGQSDYSNCARDIATAFRAIIAQPDGAQ